MRTALLLIALAILNLSTTLMKINKLPIEPLPGGIVIVFFVVGIFMDIGEFFT